MVEATASLSGIRGCLLDLSGVLHVGAQPLPGAVAAVARLRRLPLALRFITNTSRTPRAAILGQLRRMGFAVSSDELITAPLVARTALENRGLRPYLLVHPDLRPDFGGVPTHHPNAVVVGDAGTHFTYRRLNRALQILMTGAPFLAIANNRYFMDIDGLNLDAGAFVAGLEFASGRRAEVLGKPAPAVFLDACTAMNLEPSAVVMIGDDAHADVLGALDAGLQAILVKTGKFRESDAALVAGRARVLDDLTAVAECLETESIRS